MFKGLPVPDKEARNTPHASPEKIQGGLLSALVSGGMEVGGQGGSFEKEKPKVSDTYIQCEFTPYMWLRKHKLRNLHKFCLDTNHWIPWDPIRNKCWTVQLWYSDKRQNVLKVKSLENSFKILKACKQATNQNPQGSTDKPISTWKMFLNLSLSDRLIGKTSSIL